MRRTGWRTAFAARAHRQRFLGRRTRLAPHASAALPRHAQARGRAPTLVPLRPPDARVSACQRGLGAQGAAALVVAHFMLLRRQRLQHCPAAAAPPRQRGSAHLAAVVESCDARCLGPRMRQSGCGQAKGGTRVGWFRRSFLASGAYGQGQLAAQHAVLSVWLLTRNGWIPFPLSGGWALLGLQLLRSTRNNERVRADKAKCVLISTRARQLCCAPRAFTPSM